MSEGPIHHLENVPSEPGTVQTACKKFKWRTRSGLLLDKSKLTPHTVTCSECLAVMADVQPDVTVEVRVK